MKPRCLPLWLLRDVPALLGVMISFWPLMILVIRNGLAAMRGKPIPRSAFEKLPHLLAHAESWLDFAILREVYRRIGWNHRRVQFALHDSPETWPETEARFHRYQRIRRNPEAYARACVEDLCAQYRITKRAAHGSTGARPCRAALHELVGLAPIALILSSAPCARPSKDERGPVHARGPPLPPISQIRNTPPRAHLRDRARLPPARNAPIHLPMTTSATLIRLMKRATQLAPARRS